MFLLCSWTAFEMLLIGVFPLHFVVLEYLLLLPSSAWVKNQPHFLGERQHRGHAFPFSDARSE